MIKFHHQSIVRNGNHFIKLGQDYGTIYRDEWFLIDGPWFEYLERFKQSTVYLRPYSLMSMESIGYNGCPDISYIYTPPTVWERCLLRLTAMGRRFHKWPHGFYHRIADKYDNIVYHHIDNILVKYSYIYSWRCNEGVLPAWIKNPEWDDALEELFTYTTYNELEKM